jgi:sugar/nucleoside kinase (ribokinase family)
MKTYDLYAIGNALVDTEFEITDAQLHAMGVDKRHMTLIDGPRRAELVQQLGGQTSRRTGGGSAGNTVVALAQLGGKAFYSCRVANDELGQFYAQDLSNNGVATNLTHIKAQEGQTGSCMVLITPDAERSMCTYLGATAELDEAALHEQDIVSAKVYYMEGYLAASPSGLQAAVKGRQIAKSAGVALAATLSDVSMIRFCKPGLDAIVGIDLDYLFCNEEEAQVWCATQDLEAICSEVSKLAATVCLTRGPQGCIVIQGERRTVVAAVSVNAVDTNGAGDMFAGAFLYAVTHGYSASDAASLGNAAAAKVVSQYGNRLTQAEMKSIQHGLEQSKAG